MASRNVSFGSVGPAGEQQKTKDYYDRRRIAPYLLDYESTDEDRKVSAGSNEESKGSTSGSTQIAGEADAAAGTAAVLRRVSSLSILRTSPTLQRPTESPATELTEKKEVRSDREESPAVQPSWRLKARLRTTHVGLIMSLNIGTDPPDLTKPHPCARLQCWMDPSSMSRAKARKDIGKRLEEQYKAWQPQRAPDEEKVYRHAPDPTVDDVRDMCLWLRRQAKNERVLLHFNGHGVPRPTPGGEIWVFDKEREHFIPLYVTELRQWVGKPSIMVLDCSNAGVLTPLLTSPLTGSEEAASSTPERDMEATSEQIVRDIIVLSATSEGELLPMHPDYPADIFTSCLTTPIEIALRHFIRRNPQSMGSLSPEVVDLIPGTRGDRKTPLGELNWIFAAVTDCIAWNLLPKPLFQRLFRQGHMLAGIFRNFMLADRIMRTLNCTPQSYPPLPPGVHVHQLWEAWDLACETFLSGLLRDGLIGNHMLVDPTGQGVQDISQNIEADSVTQTPAQAASPRARPPSSQSSPFFSEQLIAFEVWLEFATIARVSQADFDVEDPYEAPEQLPILLQALLSPAHRSRALILLRRFLELGPWAVNVALCLGTLPYVLKLLQSTEYKPDLVGIWSSILHFDSSIQEDLVRDGGLSHFVNLLTWGITVSAAGDMVSVSPEEGSRQRSMAAFILASTCLGYSHGQHECIRYNLHGTICSLLSSAEFGHGSEKDSGFEVKKTISEQRLPPEYRVWLCICLANLVKSNKVVQGEAFGAGAHRRLFARVDDDSHEVRAAACYALGCLIDISTAASHHKTAPAGGRGTLLPSALIPNRLVGTPHQGTGLMVADVAANGVPRQFHPGFLSGMPTGPTNLQWRPQQSTVAPSLQPLPLYAAPTSFPATNNAESSPGGLSAVSAVFQDSERILLDLAVAEVLQTVINDGTPVVRYECIISLSCVVEKYLALFVAVADESVVVGDPSQPETHADDRVSALTNHEGRIPLPAEVTPGVFAKSAGVWKAIRRAQHHDPHPAVASAANSVVSVVHEHILNIKMRATETQTQGNTEVKRILSDAHMRSLDEEGPLEDPGLTRSTVAGLGSFDFDGQAPLRRTASEYNVPAKERKGVRRSRIERCLTSRDVVEILAGRPSSNMDYVFPRSNYYEWKKASFMWDDFTGRLDPLSLDGAAESYREQRNRNLHDYGKRIASHFESLAPEPPRPQRHRFDFIEYETEENMRQASEHMLEKKKELELKQTALLRESDSSISTLLCFHPYEDILVAGDVEGGISLWDFRKRSRHLRFRNGNPRGTRMTSGSWINETSNSLFMVGSEDGSVRIWDNFLQRNGHVATSSPTLSTAFVAVPHMAVNDRLSGLILEWQQYNGRLIAGGNSSSIWCWDLSVDKPTTVIETGSNACVTSLNTTWRYDSAASRANNSHVVSPDVIIAGQSDGMLKLFDLRSNRTATELNPGRSMTRRSRRIQYDEHRDWIVGASYTTYGGRDEIVSASIDGVIKVWDVRVAASSMRTYNVQRSALTTLTVHPEIPILATGSSAQFVKVVSMDGDTVQTIIDLGHRIGPVTRLAFHPFRPVLAAADQEMVISLYSPKNPKWEM